MTGKISKKTAEGLVSEKIHIHLLHTGEGSSQSPMTHLLSFLPVDERKQYRRFELESRRREFLFSRLFARHLLSFHSGKKMRDMQFTYGKQGKPFLKGSALQFSLSHTKGLIAFSLGQGEMGVDVEKIEDGPLGQERGRLLAGRFFSLLERDYLQSFPMGLQNLAFFWIFTMKEAYAKAWGLGLSLPLNCLTVPLTGLEQSQSGSWEWFTRIEGDFCLSHALKNPTRSPHEYQIFHWDEKSVINAVKNNHSLGLNQLCA